MMKQCVKKQSISLHLPYELALSHLLPFDVIPVFTVILVQDDVIIFELSIQFHYFPIICLLSKPSSCPSPSAAEDLSIDRRVCTHYYYLNFFFFYVRLLKKICYKYKMQKLTCCKRRALSK